MDCHMCVLVVITLLQLCRAVLTETIPGTWISANTINDGYSPKPISELFSTPEPSPNFSPENPIVVLSTIAALPPEPGVTYFSTTQTPFNSFSSTTSAPPPTYSSSGPPSTIFTDAYSIPSLSQLDFSRTSSIAPQWSTSTTALPNLATERPVQRPIQTLQQALAIAPLHPENQPTGPQNFAVVYENTPSPIQSISSFPPQTTVTEIPTVFTTTTTTTTSSPLTSFSDGTITPYLPSRLPDPTSRPTVTFRSTPPSTTSRTTLFNRDSNPETTRYLAPVTEEPLRIVPGPPDVPFNPNLRIRVVAPHGSITNLKINPTTTTKRPTTKKTKKPKKNTYEACLDGCKVRREPICAVPLSSTIIDPNTLKGFPSICHLACHNSYKKEAYEKLVDGRCGRLRTRIISVDTNSKIKTQDLKKGEYSIINTGPKSVVEFARGNTK